MPDAHENEPLSARVGFSHLADGMGADVRSAIDVALESGVVFAAGTDALAIFRSSIDAAVRDIERDRRGRLVQRLLRDGPYEGEEPTSSGADSTPLSQEETEGPVNFIYGSMVNTFKGELTELLSAGACARLLDNLRRDGTIPSEARIYAGRSVLLPGGGRRRLQGADLHVLIVKPDAAVGKTATLVGVAEVKSGPKSHRALERQLDRHIERASKRGLHVAGVTYTPQELRVGVGGSGRVLRVTAQPSDWLLPRTIRYEASSAGRRLVFDPVVPPSESDDLCRLDAMSWDVRLRWSKEAVAATAYEMTLWYMGMVGAVIYKRADDGNETLPRGWEEMSVVEAGRNAAKMMLYYAIRPYAIKDEDGMLTKRERGVMGKMIALYNTYGFGYALGMNFRRGRRREMLWPEDLDELAAAGRTKNGGRVVGVARRALRYCATA